MSVLLRSQRHVEAFARDALVVPQFAPLHVGERRVREDQLPGREARAHVLRAVHAGAEERDLEAELALARNGAPGEVPPFGAEIRMRAMIARETQLGRRQRERRLREEGGGRQQQGPAAHHQSSFTASTASRPAAARPASHAVTVPAATTAAHSAINRSHGTSRSIVQWKLCGFTT
jgi:hypothetical protein